MKRPVEHGNVFTSIILGVSSIIIAVVSKREFYSILFWIPIWMGLFLYDVPLKRLFKSKVDVAWLLLITALSIFAIHLDYLLLIPYVIFFATYALRLQMAARKLNYVGTSLGILAFVVLFAQTTDLGGSRGFLLLGALFVYMIGSEFSVRAKLSNNKTLLIYDLIPTILVVLNPVFLVFSLSVVRIPVAIKSKWLRTVGVTETLLLLVVITTISLLYVLNF